MYHNSPAAKWPIDIATCAADTGRPLVSSIPMAESVSLKYTGKEARGHFQNGSTQTRAGPRRAWLLGTCRLHPVGFGKSRNANPRKANTSVCDGISRAPCIPVCHSPGKPTGLCVMGWQVLCASPRVTILGSHQVPMWGHCPCSLHPLCN